MFDILCPFVVDYSSDVRPIVIQIEFQASDHQANHVGIL